MIDMINEMAALIGRVAIYSLMFIVSLYFVNQADKTKSRGKFIFLSLLALIIPCLFAAFRGEKVGTDVLQYAKPYYLGALNSSNLQAFLLQGLQKKDMKCLCFASQKFLKISLRYFFLQRL